MGTVKYSGPVASFHCPTEATIRSLKVHFSPKQLGSGDPSPENIREIVGWDGVEVFQKGKNLFDYTNTIIIDKKNRNNDGVQVSDSTGSYNQTPIDVQPLTQYTMNGFGAKSSKAVYYLKKDGSWISKELFSSKTGPWIFTTPQGCYQLQVQSAEVASALWETLVIEVGSGSGLRTPYYGSTTNYTFGVLGKNKFPAADGTTSDIFLAANTTYTFSATSPSAGYFKGWYEDETDTGLIWINAGEDGNRRWKTYTPERNIIKGLFYVGTGMSECQIELGSTATAYEPYDPKHTVYGGWVDLISGEVQQEWGQRILNGSETWNTQSPNTTYNRKFLTSFASDGIQSLNIFVNWIRPISTGSDAGMFINGNLCCRLGWADKQFYILNAVEYLDEVVDIASLKEYLSNHNLQVVYPLATPNTYQLAPTQLQTFLGQNNVWSNADYVEVEYDLHETQTILERKAFILANQAKIKTASGSPATFTTTTHAPLKSAKVYFTPVQTGSGTPSPTNVRPILGWKQAGLVINRGKNLINEDALIQNTGIDASGNNRTWDTTKANDFLYLPPGDYILTGTYTGTDASANLRVHGYSHEQKWLQQITYQAKGPNQSYSIPFTMTADMPYMRFSANKDVTNIQLEAGSAATTYEAFSGRELSVNWGDVIYGGYVDLISGKVWRTWALQTAETSAEAVAGRFGVTYQQGKGIKFPVVNKDALSGDWHNYCTHFADGYPVLNWSMDASSKDVVAEGEGQEIMFVNSSLGFETKEEWSDWILNNNVIFTYPLATPVLVTTLTPSQLSDFVRTNIVTPYSNSNVEVQYWTH